MEGVKRLMQTTSDSNDRTAVHNGARDRVIVTGSAGLLGRHVASAFAAAGWSVRGIDQTPHEAGAGIDVAVADLTIPEAAREAIGDADCLVHCAAIPRPTGSPPKTVFDTNIALMYNAISAAEAYGIKRFVYASSFSVLGLPFAPMPVQISWLPVDERHPVAPQDMYALSKWLGEEMLDAWVRRTRTTAVSLRLPWVQTAASFAREVGPRRRSSDAALDLFAYVDAHDAADAFVAAARADIEGHERLFVCAADTYSEAPTASLVATHMPDVQLRLPLAGHTGLIDSTRAEQTIGFRARRSWRDYPNPQDPPAGEPAR